MIAGRPGYLHAGSSPVPSCAGGWLRAEVCRELSAGRSRTAQPREPPPSIAAALFSRDPFFSAEDRRSASGKLRWTRGIMEEEQRRIVPVTARSRDAGSVGLWPPRISPTFLRPPGRRAGDAASEPRGAERKQGAPESLELVSAHLGRAHGVVSASSARPPRVAPMAGTPGSST